MVTKLKKIAKKIIFYLNTNLKFRRKGYLQEIQNRSQLPLTAINQLSKNISILSAYSLELHQPNDFYGHATALKKYADFSPDYQLKFIIQHGIVFADHMFGMEDVTEIPSFVTLGKHRAEIIKKYKVNRAAREGALGYKSHTFVIGPYIHYASPYLSTTETNQEKKRLGNCLTIFPAHSSLEIRTHYDVEKFAKKIQKIATEFDSVRICLYWKDILHGIAKPYQKLGFECVTAGHVLDPNFLPRLKSIIETSSYTASNSIGTHTGYCIHLNKPNYIFRQKFNFTGRKSEVELTESDQDDRPYAAFTTFTKKITVQQRKVVDFYWGTSQIKTKKQMRDLFKKTEQIYQDSFRN